MLECAIKLKIHTKFIRLIKVNNFSQDIYNFLLLKIIIIFILNP